MKYKLLPFYFKIIGVAIFATSLTIGITESVLTTLPKFKEHSLLLGMGTAILIASLLFATYYLSRSLIFLGILFAFFYVAMLLEYLHADEIELNMYVSEILQLFGLLLFAMAKDQKFDEYSLSLRMEAIQLSFAIIYGTLLIMPIFGKKGHLPDFVLMRDLIIYFWLIFKIKKRLAINSTIE